MSETELRVLKRKQDLQIRAENFFSQVWKTHQSEEKDESVLTILSDEELEGVFSPSET